MAGVKNILLSYRHRQVLPSSLFCKDSTFKIFLAHLKAHCHRIITLPGWRGPQEISSPDSTLNSGPGYSEFFPENLQGLKDGTSFTVLMRQSPVLLISLVSPCAHYLLSTCHRLLWRVQSRLHNDPAGTGGWCQPAALQPSVLSSTNVVPSVPPHMTARTVSGASDEVSQVLTTCWCLCRIGRPRTRCSITRFSLLSAEQRIGIIPSLHLLALSLVTETRMMLTIFAARAHCWLILHALPHEEA